MSKWDVSTCHRQLLCIIVRVNLMETTQTIASVHLHHYPLLRGKLYYQMILAIILWSRAGYCQFIPVQILLLHILNTFENHFNWGRRGSNQSNLCIYILVLGFRGSCNELLEANITGCFSAERSQMKWPSFHLLFFSAFEVTSFWRDDPFISHICMKVINWSNKNSSNLLYSGLCRLQSLTFFFC